MEHNGPPVQWSVMPLRLSPPMFSDGNIRNTNRNGSHHFYRSRGIINEIQKGGNGVSLRREHVIYHVSSMQFYAALLGPEPY